MSEIKVSNSNLITDLDLKQQKAIVGGVVKHISETSYSNGTTSTISFVHLKADDSNRDVHQIIANPGEQATVVGRRGYQPEVTSNAEQTTVFEFL